MICVYASTDTATVFDAAVPDRPLADSQYWAAAAFEKGTLLLFRWGTRFL